MKLFAYRQNLFLLFLFAVAIVIPEVVYIQQKDFTEERKEKPLTSLHPALKSGRLGPTAHRAALTHPALCSEQEPTPERHMASQETLESLSFFLPILITMERSD